MFAGFPIGFFLIGPVVLVALPVGFSVQSYFRNRGRRTVVCPENHEPVAVELDNKFAFETALRRQEHERLQSCSRWPEKEACGQECLAQIQEAPKACLVWTIINRWYQGQKCVYCHKPFGEIHWHDPPPALLDFRAQNC